MSERSESVIENGESTEAYNIEETHEQQNGVSNNKYRKLLDGPCFFKFRVRNVVAGTIIGKSGSVIAEIERVTGCTVKLSPGNFYYNNATSRIVVISGEIDAVKSAIKIVVQKIVEYERARALSTENTERNEEHDISVVVSVPKQSAKEFHKKYTDELKKVEDEEDVTTNFFGKDDTPTEKYLTISGTHQGIETVALLVAEHMKNDPDLKNFIRSFNYTNYKTIRYLCNMNHYIGAGHSHGPYSQYGSPPLYGVANPSMSFATETALYPTFDYSRFPELLNHKCEISIRIPDEYVGLLIGRSGACLAEITRASGARVQISSKGDLISGSDDRKCIITGAVAYVHHAHILLLVRLQSVKNLARGGADQHMNFASGNTNGIILPSLGIGTPAPPYHSYSNTYNGGY